MTMIVECASSLELGELLDGLAGAGKDTEDVEADLHTLIRKRPVCLVWGVSSQSWREVCIGQR
jgi:hypothetical protein